MKRKTLKKALSAFLSLLMCMMTLLSISTPVFAATTVDAYMVDFPRDGDSNYSATAWGHSATSLMGGWRFLNSKYTTVHSIGTYNGQVSYCIEPGIGQNAGDTLSHKDETFWENYPSHLNPTISPDTIKVLLGRIMQYGYQGNVSTSWRSQNASDAAALSHAIATQLLVWETVVGERDASFNKVDPSGYGKSAVWSYIRDEHPLRSQIRSYYNSMAASVQSHAEIPSFCARSIGSARSYELKYDGTRYTVTLTDTNGVLSNFSFSSSEPGISFSRSGNRLTITSDMPIAGDIRVSASKTNGVRSGVVVWTDGNKGAGIQDVVTYGENVSDPVSAYLRLEMEALGTMHLVKTSEDGVVAGISFTISGNGITKTVTTGRDGTIDVSELMAGTYTVTEADIERYTPQTSQQVTIVGGQTSTVTFNNVLKRGALEVTKTSEDGFVEGVKFRLYGKSLSGLSVDEYAVTDSTGVAKFRNVLIGGPYTIEEVDTAVRAELETPENMPTPQTEVEIPAATEPTAPEGSAYFVSPDAAAPENAQETAASDDAKDAAEPAAGETPMPNQADTETPAESEPEAADTLIPGQNEAEPEPENGSVPTAEFKPSGNAGIIEQPEAGAMFQLYLSSAGSYDAAKDSERDLLVTDENGVALSKDLPYGRYTVHQIEGQEGQAFVPDFTVFINSNGHLYSYILNNQTITSFIRVEKRDAETGKIIPAAGIGFQVRDLTSGELISQTVYYPAPVTISTFYTADDGTLMLPCELPYGRYELIEVTTCHGYVLDTAPVPFTVDGSEAVVTVTKSNMAQKGVIRIQKTGEVFSSVVNEGSIFRPVYENTGLPGAVFDIAAAEDIYTPDGTLRAKAGDIVDTVTTQSDGMAASKALYLGKYVITEKQAPHGMALQTEPHTVELVYAGQEVTVTELRADMYNERQRVEISLVKTMETDKLFGIGQSDELTHVTFGLYAAEKLVAADGSSIPQDGLIEMVSLNKDGKATCKTDLPFGRFYLQEISTDSHYQLGNTKYPVSFDYAGQDKKLVKLIANEGAAIENKLIYGSVSGLKVDANDKPLSGAVMGLFAASETRFTKDTALLTAVSAEDGRFRFEKIPAGNWLVREIEQPKGFVLSEELFPVTVKEQGQVIEIKIANKLIRGSVTLTKYDADYPENKLSGAVFEVYRDVNGNKALDKDDVLLGTMKESSAGVYWMKDLEYGGVLVREKTAPEGFIPDEKAYYVEIDTDGKTYTVENEAGKGFINRALKGSLKIIKTTSDGKKEGFAFRITGANGYDMTFTTDAKGEIFIEKLRVGEYTVTELKNSASEGYKIADPVKITLVANETLTVKIHNDKTKVDVPKTGDDADLMLWISLLGLAAAGVGCTAFFYLKKRRTGKHIAVKK